MSNYGLNWWVGFNIFVVLMLVIDLGFLQRKIHSVKLSESLKMCAVWISLALLFAVLLF